MRAESTNDLQFLGMEVKEYGETNGTQIKYKKTKIETTALELTMKILKGWRASAHRLVWIAIWAVFYCIDFKYVVSEGHG